MFVLISGLPITDAAISNVRKIQHNQLNVPALIFVPDTGATYFCVNYYIPHAAEPILDVMVKDIKQALFNTGYTRSKNPPSSEGGFFDKDICNKRLCYGY
jgi:hypothetical protein